MPDAAPLKILLVEDTDSDAKLVQKALANISAPRFKVSRVTTLQQALAQLAGNNPDAVMLDLSLPDAEGEETLLRMREAAQRLPIIVMTGHDDLNFANHMVELGAQDYLVKDGEPERLVVRTILYAMTRMQAIIDREEMLDHLLSAIETKKRLFGLLAHDLSNPISSIALHAELLGQEVGGQASERARKCIGNILESTQHAKSLIRDTLLLARQEVTGLLLNRKPVNLSKLAARAVERNAAYGRKKGVELHFDGKSAAAPLVVVDAIKIDEILNNLISNAIKFSHPGGKVRVSISKQRDVARLSVTDCGVGIAPEIHETLFQPFCRGQKGTRGEDTNGLGLYICEQIATAHGGRIDFNSKPGEGTEITVSLPLGAAE
jgi:signal transduction histidine kinase